MTLTMCSEIFTWLFKLNVQEIAVNVFPCSQPQITCLHLYLPRAMYIILKKEKWRGIKDIVSIYVFQSCEVEPSHPRTAQIGPRATRLNESTIELISWCFRFALPFSQAHFVTSPYRRRHCSFSEGNHLTEISAYSHYSAPYPWQPVLMENLETTPHFPSRYPRSGRSYIHT